MRKGAPRIVADRGSPDGAGFSQQHLQNILTVFPKRCRPFFSAFSHASEMRACSQFDISHAQIN